MKQSVSAKEVKQNTRKIPSSYPLLPSLHLQVGHTRDRKEGCSMLRRGRRLVAGVCDWTLKGALSASLTRVHSRMDAQVVCGRSDQGGRLAGDLQDL